MHLRSTLLATFLGGSSLLAADLPPLPHAATSFGAAEAGGWAYVYGGNTGKAHEFHRDCINGDFFRLQMPEGKEWQSLPTSSPLLGAAMAQYAGDLYRVGGLEARNAKGETDDLRSVAAVERYRAAEGKWEAVASLPQARSSHDVVVVGDTLYVGGGWFISGVEPTEKRHGVWEQTLAKLDLKHPEKGWSTELQPFQRRALAMAVHEGRIWFLGGMDETDAPSWETDWYEPATGQWGKGPTLPEGQMRGFGMAACVVNGRLIASPVTGKLFSLSADRTQWEEFGQLQRPRFFHRLLPYSATEALAVGGSDRKAQILEPEIVPIPAAVAAQAVAASVP